MNTVNDKYVCFKKEDWDYWATQGYFNDTSIEQEALTDFEVIRHQDIFAAPCFHEYASAIQTAIEILKSYKLGEYTRAHLEEKRDYFAAAALRAEAFEPKKVPD